MDRHCPLGRPVGGERVEHVKLRFDDDVDLADY